MQEGRAPVCKGRRTIDILTARRRANITAEITYAQNKKCGIYIRFPVICRILLFT